jgi:PRTRC genetic system protein C
MAIEVMQLNRTFSFNGVDLPDPGQEFSPEDVKEMYANQYPDLLTAIVDGPNIVGDKEAYIFVRNVGTKG